MWVTIDEVKTAFRKMQPRKAIGKDGIPAEFFRNASNVVVSWFVDFFNSFLVHNCLPSALMNVIMVPLTKSKIEANTVSDNYRPIAIAAS